MHDIQVFDRGTVRLRRDRAAAQIDSVADILRDTAERLLDRLDDVTRSFSRALDLGGRGIVAPMLRARGIETISADLSHRMAARNPGPSVVLDEEFLPIAPGSVDLIVAHLSLHWVNDLPGALIQMRRALAPDGLLLASLPALGTLAELRTALAQAEGELSGGVSPRVSPFPELGDCANLLVRAGFHLPLADIEEIQLLYADPFALIRDLRSAGETNAVRVRNRRLMPRMLIPAALSLLPDRDRRRPVTLRMAVMTGWAPGDPDKRTAA